MEMHLSFHKTIEAMLARKQFPPGIMRAMRVPAEMIQIIAEGKPLPASRNITPRWEWIWNTRLEASISFCGSHADKGPLQVFMPFHEIDLFTGKIVDQFKPQLLMDVTVSENGEIIQTDVAPISDKLRQLGC